MATSGFGKLIHPLHETQRLSEITEAGAALDTTRIVDVRHSVYRYPSKRFH